MSDMGSRHKVIVVSKDRVCSVVNASMDGDILAKNVAVTGDYTGGNALVESPELGIGSNNGSGPDKTARPEPGSLPDLGGSLDDTTVSQNCIVLDDRIGPNRDSGANMSQGGNDGGLVNWHRMRIECDDRMILIVEGAGTVTMIDVAQLSTGMESTP